MPSRIFVFRSLPLCLIATSAALTDNSRGLLNPSSFRREGGPRKGGASNESSRRSGSVAALLVFHTPGTCPSGRGDIEPKTGQTGRVRCRWPPFHRRYVGGLS